MKRPECAPVGPAVRGAAASPAPDGVVAAGIYHVFEPAGAQRAVPAAAARALPGPAPLIYTFVGRSQTPARQPKGEAAGKLLLSPDTPENDPDWRIGPGGGRWAVGGARWAKGGGRWAVDTGSVSAGTVT